MKFEEIVRKFKNKKLTVNFDKDEMLDMPILEQIDYESAIKYNRSMNLTYYLLCAECLHRQTSVKQVTQKQLDLADEENRKQVSYEKRGMIAELKSIFDLNKVWDIIDLEGIYKREDFDAYKNIYDKTENNKEDTKKLIYLVKKYKEYLRYANMNNRIYSQKFKNIRKTFKLDDLTLTDEEKQKVQAVCDVFEYLNTEDSTNKIGNNKFSWFIFSESEELLKLMIRRGVDLDETFEKSPRLSRKLKYKYNDLLRARGATYLERVIPILRKTQRMLKVPVSKLMYDFNNEAFYKIETETCDELIERLEKLLVIEEDYEKKKQEQDRIKQEQERLEKELEGEKEKEERARIINALKVIQEKRKEEEEARKPIQAGEGKSEEFSKKIEELRNDAGPRQRVIPIFLHWYGKLDKNFNSDDFKEFKEMFFEALRKIEEKTKIRTSLFIFTDSSVEESKKIMEQIQDEASRRGLDKLVEGIAAEHGSYMISRNEELTQMCAMSGQIYDKIIGISKPILESFSDAQINEEIKSYVNYQFQVDRYWTDDYNRFITRRIFDTIQRSSPNQAIEYRSYSNGSKKGIDIILHEQAKAEDKIKEYYHSRYMIDENNIKTVNISGLAQEKTKKRATKKAAKGDKINDRSKEITDK